MELIEIKKEIQLEQTVWLIESDLISLGKIQRRSVVTHFLESMEESYRLNHRPEGVPFLSNDSKKEISISYSGNYAVIYLNDSIEVGIDIQEIEPRIERALSIFLSKDELMLLNEDLFLQTAAWSVKEAVFKRLNGSLKSLKEDLTILELSRTHAKVQTTIGMISLKITEYNNCAIAFTID